MTPLGHGAGPAVGLSLLALAPSGGWRTAGRPRRSPVVDAKPGVDAAGGPSKAGRAWPSTTYRTALSHSSRLAAASRAPPTTGRSNAASSQS